MAQVKPKVVARAAPRSRKTTKTKPRETALRGLSADEAREAVKASMAAAVEGVRSATPVTLGPLGAAQASASDITDEIERGGPAFGSFIKSVGLGVAAAQTELDANLVATAKALSEAQINVIAVFEQVLNDADGLMSVGNVHMQKLPLINYLMPTAYQWTRVFLQADMRVSEFNSANGFNISSNSSSLGIAASASYDRKKGLGVSGSVSYGTSSYAASGEASVSADTAAATIHMDAELKPRGEIRLPSPFVLQKGPRLTVLVGGSEGLKADGTTTTTASLITGRRVSLTAKLVKTAGAVHNGQPLEVTIDQPTLSYRTSHTSGGVATSTTDANGKLLIEIDRNGAAFDPTKPLPTSVQVRFGLVSQTVGITL
jgi:hypothetical protein